MAENLLLAGLPSSERARLTTRADSVVLQKGQRLFEAGERVRHAWFPMSGLISLLGGSAAGQSAELAMVGADGSVWLPAIQGGTVAPYRAVVHIAGAALRVEARHLESELTQSGHLQDALRQAQHRVLAAVAQSTVCHAFHLPMERLCGWLLAATECVQGDRVELTHESLSAILGVGRAAVSLAAVELENAQAIRNRRGLIVILNRERLERSACECYDARRGRACSASVSRLAEASV